LIFEIITLNAKRGIILSFEQFNLSPKLMSGLNDVKFDNPTPLQNQVIPPALEGKHLLVNTTEKNGEEGAFLVPALQKMISGGEAQGTRILILTPSVERANKIDELIWAMGYHAQIECASLSMRGNYSEQEKAVENGAPVVVANPGRLYEILDKNKFELNHLQLLIIDEAHEMYNFNMVKSVGSIMKYVKSEPQVLILSDKYNDSTRELAEMALQNPEIIGFDVSLNGKSSRPEKPVSKQKTRDSKPDEASSGSQNDEPEAIPEELKQIYINVPPRAKISTLMAHLKESKTDRVVVFAASKRTTDRLYKIFRKRNWNVVSIHEQLDEETFNQRYNSFKEGQKQFLLVGGMAANKLDLESVRQVINYDVPSDVDEYRYRAELVNTGKASQVLSLVSKMDRDDIKRIVEEVGYEPKEIPLPEEVKEKKKRGGNKNKGNRNRGSSKSRGSRGSGNGNKGRQKKKKSKKDELPRPNYENLPGGREGGKLKETPEPESGITGFFKKLFS